MHAMMRSTDGAGPGGRRTTAVLVAFGMTLLAACSNNDTKNLINTGIDCGLVRSDLTGSWQVSFTPDSALTVSCDTASFDGTSITVTSTPTSYPGVLINGSDTSASFLVTGDSVANPLTGPELIGSVQADSCLALFRVWDNGDKAFVQCLGTFDRTSRTIAAACDSADIDNPVGSPIEATCDLNPHLLASVGIL